MNQHNRQGIVRRMAGVAVLALLAAACGGSSDGADPADSTPVSEPVVPISEAPVTLAPAVTEPPVTEPVAEPTVIPDLPCADYVEETGYPLKPCDSGVLTETLQRDLVSLFPSIAIDGLFGNQTFQFIKEFQTSNGLEATGLVSEELAGQIAAAEEVGSDQQVAGDTVAPADTGVTADE